MRTLLTPLLLLLLFAWTPASLEARDAPAKAPARMADATRVTQRNFRVDIQGTAAGSAVMRLGRMKDGSVLQEIEFLIKVARGAADEADLFVIQQRSLEYHDKAGRLRWKHSTHTEAGVEKVITETYDDETVRIRFRGPASAWERTLKLPKKHDGGLLSLRRLKRAFEQDGAATLDYVKLDAENQVFEPVTLTLKEKTTVEHGGKSHDGWVVHEEDHSGPSVLVLDADFLPMRGTMLGVIEMVWVDKPPVLSGAGWQISSFIPVHGKAPMDKHLVSLEITIKAPKDGKGSGPKDDRPLFRTTRYQTAKQVDGVWKLTLHSTQPPADAPKVTLPVKVEDKAVTRYLRPTPQSQSDHPTIVAKAKEIVGQTTDATVATAKIVEWVYANLDKRSGARGSETAVEVLQSCVGDCTEHAALTVALCRAVGIPARNVGGLEYLTFHDGEPAAGFHAWAEVWLGRWVGVDATIPEVGTAARYILMDIDEAGESTEHDVGFRALLGGLELHIDAYTHAGGKRTVVSR